MYDFILEFTVNVCLNPTSALSHPAMFILMNESFVLCCFLFILTSQEAISKGWIHKYQFLPTPFLNMYIMCKKCTWNYLVYLLPLF